MRTLRRPTWWQLLVWAMASIIGAVGLARSELASLREAFETDARISHRLLSQQAVQHEAVLATLALLQPAAHIGSEQRVEQRLSAVYPQFVEVLRRDPGQRWPNAALDPAEAASRLTHRPALALLALDQRPARYTLVLAGAPTSFAITVDVLGAVPWADWSMPRQGSPVQVSLSYAGQNLVIQPGIGVGAAQESSWTQGWRFAFVKHLASESQPFDVVVQRQVGWLELPWLWMLAWGLACALAVAGVAAVMRQRTARRRAEELLRFGQVARLNALGELAAGMAHELSQPLTAVLANTQAARRMLDSSLDAAGATRLESDTDMAQVHTAMDQAVAQARRATEVLARLRKAVEPGTAASVQGGTDADAPAAIALEPLVRQALHLLEPECRARQVSPRVVATTVQVLADPVAAEQIVHNLITNALQALDEVPPHERALQVDIEVQDGMGVLRVRDSGPGLSAQALLRVFEPFYTTRSTGLGLGLSLCETLATGMGGRLQAYAHGLGWPERSVGTGAAITGAHRGAAFVLTLPLASGTSPTTQRQPGH